MWSIKYFRRGMKRSLPDDVFEIALDSSHLYWEEMFIWAMLCLFIWFKSSERSASLFSLIDGMALAYSLIFCLSIEPSLINWFFKLIMSNLLFLFLNLLMYPPCPAWKSLIGKYFVLSDIYKIKCGECLPTPEFESLIIVLSRFPMFSCFVFRVLKWTNLTLSARSTNWNNVFDFEISSFWTSSLINSFYLMSYQN